MLVVDGYGLSYDKGRNRITITLPQTVHTPTNTIEPVADRRVDAKEEEMAVLLSIVMWIFKKEEE